MTPELQNISSRFWLNADRPIRAIPEAATAFDALGNFATQYRFSLKATNGYRSYDEQVKLYNEGILKHGDEVRKFVAKPGNSNHNAGTAFDIFFGIKNIAENADQVRSSSLWSFLVANMGAFRFRFYDRNIEPWHIEYVVNIEMALNDRAE